ncbi:MAG: DNA polymerase III subunit gamma/tau, partial [Planctomycetota bacterium]
MKSNEYQVLARKYRPQYFDEVVGQLPIARTLKNAIQSKRVAHAYLFCGTRGVGKTSMARILAKSLNCLSNREPTITPCQTCDACVSISQGEDIDVIEIDGASNRGIDEIRNIQKEVGLKPSRSQFKIYIIDEVHMLTIQAFNALLKILEEPPVHVKFIFATTQAYDVPETIHSRCQRFDFRRISEKDIVVRLQQICEAEQVSFEGEVLNRIATLATGGLRDSQSILDQLISATNHQKLTLQSLEELMGWVQQSDLRAMTQYLLEGNTSQALHLMLQIYERGNDLTDFIDQLLTKFRALMIFSYTEDASLTDETSSWLETMAPLAQKDFFLYAIQLLLETQNKMKQMIQSKILLEMALVKLSQTRRMLPFNELLKRAQELEFKLIEKVGPLPPPILVSPVVRTETMEAISEFSKTTEGDESSLLSTSENTSSEESEGATKTSEDEKLPEVDFQ